MVMLYLVSEAFLFESFIQSRGCGFFNHNVLKINLRFSAFEGVQALTVKPTLMVTCQ
jgi:hypothetical protein